MEVVSDIGDRGRDRAGGTDREGGGGGGTFIFLFSLHHTVRIQGRQVMEMAYDEGLPIVAARRASLSPTRLDTLDHDARSAVVGGHGVHVAIVQLRLNHPA